MFIYIVYKNHIKKDEKFGKVIRVDTFDQKINVTRYVNQ